MIQRLLALLVICSTLLLSANATPFGRSLLQGKRCKAAEKAVDRKLKQHPCDVVDKAFDAEYISPCPVTKKQAKKCAKKIKKKMLDYFKCVGMTKALMKPLLKQAVQAANPGCSKQAKKWFKVVLSS